MDEDINLMIEYGDYTEVCRLIKTGIDINQQDSDGFTPLHFAVDYKRADILEFLLKNGADTEIAENQQQMRPIHLAAEYGFLEILELLLKYGAQIDSKCICSLQPIHLAADEGRIAIIDCLLRHGVDIDTMTERKMTPLYRAIVCQKTEMAEYLINKKANIHQKTMEGCTPLYGAASQGQKKIVKLLLEAGAKIDEMDKYGLTPLHAAARHTHINVIELLLEQGATCVLNGISKPLTPLHIAAKFGNIDVVEFFLQINADTEVQTINGYTPLHAAAQFGKLLVTEYLVEHGANIECKTHPKGCTPLYFAIRYCWPKVVELLIQQGASLEGISVKYSCALDVVPLDLDHGRTEQENVNYKECAKIIIKYTVMFNKQQKPQFAEDYPFSKDLIDFWHTCQKEIEKMERVTISNTTLALYKFIRDTFNEHKLAICLYNDVLRKEVEDIEKYLEPFPIYANLARTVENKIKSGLEKQLFLEEADLVIDRIFPRLAMDIRWKIFSYLNNKDLNNFVKAFNY